MVDELRMSEIACTILLKYGSYSSWILIEKHFDKLQSFFFSNRVSCWRKTWYSRSYNFTQIKTMAIARPTDPSNDGATGDVLSASQATSSTPQHQRHTITRSMCPLLLSS